MINVIGRLENRIKYTEPFKPETVQKLYDMRNGGKSDGDGRCGLSIINGSTDHPGVGDVPFEAFKNTPFDELWQMVTVPKYKLDRS